MFETPVRSVMQRRRLLKASPAVVVSKVAKLMAKRNVGAAMIVHDGRLVGIFTERDIVFRVIASDLDARTTRVGDVMTPTPQVIHPDKSFGQALLIMHEKGFRHLPVVENETLVGIVSARSAMDPDLEEFTAEAQRRKYLTGAR